MSKKKPNIAQYHLHKAHPEKLQFQIHDLKSYRIKAGEKAAVEHSHSFYQIIWFFNEGGTHTIDFKAYPIKKNSLLFISKDSIHAFDDNLESEGWLIHFNESFFIHNDVDLFLKYHIFNALHHPFYSIDNQMLPTVTAYLDLMRNELNNKQLFGFEDLIRYSLKSFLIILERLRQGEKRTISFNNHYELLFAKYKTLVEENYLKNLSVTDYATLLNISSKTLTTVTKKIVNKSASQIISERIILEAQRLLRFTSLQINEVAFKIGFEDSSYFIKYFKRHMGMSPKSYRKMT